MGASCIVRFSDVQKNWIMEVTWQAQCLPWGRLACAVVLPTLQNACVTSPPWLQTAQEVELLKLWSVDNLWLAEHFLLLTALLVFTLVFMSTLHLFGLWSAVDALHVQASPLSLESTMLKSYSSSCSSCQKVRQTKGLLNTLTLHSSANVSVPHLLRFLLQVPSISAMKFCTLQLEAYFCGLFHTSQGFPNCPPLWRLAGVCTHRLQANTSPQLDPACACSHVFAKVEQVIPCLGAPWMGTEGPGERQLICPSVTHQLTKPSPHWSQKPTEEITKLSKCYYIPWG